MAAGTTTGVDLVPRYEVREVSVDYHDVDDKAECSLDDMHWFGVLDTIEGGFVTGCGFTTRKVADNECVLMNSLAFSDRFVTKGAE